MTNPDVGRRRLALLIPLTLLFAVAPAEAQDRRLVELHVDSITRISSTALGLSQAAAPRFSRLQEDQVERQKQRFAEGESYLVFGVCGSTCSDLDLHVTDPSGNEVDADTDPDDSPVIAFTAATSGEYTISVSMASCSGTCDYGLGILRQTGSVETAGSSRCSTSSSSGTVRLGQRVSGTLSSSDCVRSDDTYADYHRLTLSSRTTLTITMRASAFDAYLAVVDAAGRLVDSDDDGAGGTDARVRETLEAGTYYVIANSLSKGQAGDYALSVEAQSASSARCSTSSASSTLTPGQTVNGKLTSSACTRSDDSYAVVYRLDVPSRQDLTITMRSSDFDAYLAVHDSKGESIETDDDGAGDTDARVSRTFEPGTYYVFANTLSEGETGAFTLQASAGSDSGASAGSPGARVACGASSARSAIAVGQTVRGALTSSSCVRSDGSHADVYRLVISSAQTVTLTMRSSAFDAYLALRDSQDTQVESDDDGAGGTDARISARLQPGTYYIYANTVRRGDTGAYTLEVVD